MKRTIRRRVRHQVRGIDLAVDFDAVVSVNVDDTRARKESPAAFDVNDAQGGDTTRSERGGEADG